MMILNGIFNLIIIPLLCVVLGIIVNMGFSGFMIAFISGNGGFLIILLYYIISMNMLSLKNKLELKQNEVMEKKNQLRKEKLN